MKEVDDIKFPYLFFSIFTQLSVIFCLNELNRNKNEAKRFSVEFIIV